MIIDIHGHFTTAPPQLDAYRGRQMSEVNRPSRGRLKISDDEIRESLQGQIAQMTATGIDRIIFSPRASGMGHEVGNELISLYWTQTCNDLIGRVAGLFPDRFIAACALPQSPGAGLENSVAELERCVTEMGFVGCLINPDIAGGGEPFTPRLGDRWWDPLWEKMVELDVPGMIHASSTCDPARHLNGSHYIMVDVLAVYELCASDLFERFPTLKLIVPHGGGAAPYQWNRHRALHVAAGRTPFEEAVKHIYFDTAIYDRDSFEMLVRKMGADNVLFSTEMFGTAQSIDPATGKTFDDTVDFLRDSAWLTEDDRYKIFEGNARKLFTRAKF